MFRDEFILDILDLQMRSKKKKDLWVDISNVKTYTKFIYSGVADKKILGGDRLFKLSKGGDLKKEFRETLA